MLSILKSDHQFKGDFHEFFKYWIDGQTPYGDYFTQTLDYWCHRFDDNFQHLVYEEMKSKPKESVLKIAVFGKRFVDKLTINNELVLNKVLEMSSFESMSCQQGCQLYTFSLYCTNFTNLYGAMPGLYVKVYRFVLGQIFM